MKAIVLSGGMGTRLRPLTHAMPKQLIPVANKPVLLYCLEGIRDAGITDVAVIVGDWAQEIEDVVGDGSDLGLQVSYIRQEAPFGLAHCIYIARDFLGDDPFLMYLGDNIFTSGIADLLARFEADRPAAQLTVVPVENPGEYGVAELAPDGRVLGLVEKPSSPVSRFAVAGAYFFTPLIHRAIRQISPSRRGEWEITDAVQWMVAAGYDVRAHRCRGDWRDTGRIADLLDCNRLLLGDLETAVHGDVDEASTITGPVVVGRGTRIIRSHLQGPLIIGADGVVEDSRVGPFSAIGDQCRLRRAGVTDSILLNGSSVEEVSGIHGSVIGREARVGVSLEGRGGHRLVVGDHTEVEVGT